MHPPAARRITVRGIVQGVGFRPFVYRLALRFDLRGWVLNDTGGVTIHAEGKPAILDRFAAALECEAPPASRVTSVTQVATDPENATGFEIRTSEQSGPPTTRISPDLAVCDNCLREMGDPTDRRHRYPYINCTDCGPRYSIIRSLPYDRPRTTMADWALCPTCKREYEDPADRRYHAQPTACPDCGPTFELHAGGVAIARGVHAIDQAAAMLTEGSILAVKGIGGYHLACDARCAEAVLALRERKFRKDKPFAVLASSPEAAEHLARLSPLHRELLASIARPIVLAEAAADLPGVHPDTQEIGMMLPSTPLHTMLFQAGAPDPLVMTSANRSSEPIAYEDNDAIDRLSELADAFLIGERPIQRRIDDSVITVRRGTPFMIRRARGYAPASVARIQTRRPILAVGADLKNTIALACAGEVFVSQHIGDLGELETDRAFKETIDDLLAMYAIDRRDLIVAHDMHPEYVSTRTALRIEATRHIAVQHHEAHIAAILTEHEVPSDQHAIGIALDGTGYGRDGTIWGGEILCGSVVGGFHRRPLFEPVSMPGGDAAARLPTQAAAAYLPDTPVGVLESEPFGFCGRFRIARRMIARGLRCTPSTSTGRLFDAAAAVCGFIRPITHEGQAAIWLEQFAASAHTAADLPFASSTELITTMVHQRIEGTRPDDLALGFHHAIASKVLDAIHSCQGQEASPVVLSGGVWQNALLMELVLDQIGPQTECLLPSAVPCNDGGISLGQVAIAHAAVPQPE